MLAAGKFDQRVALREPATVKGASGGFTKAWTTHPEMWGSVRHLSGNERRASKAGGEVAVSTTEISIPYREGVTEQWGVLHRGKHFNIKHVNDLLGKRERLVLTCDTGVNDG